MSVSRSLALVVILLLFVVVIGAIFGAWSKDD
jgi:hypothetical protein